MTEVQIVTFHHPDKSVGTLPETWYWNESRRTWHSSSIAGSSFSIDAPGLPKAIQHARESSDIEKDQTIFLEITTTQYVRLT
jgi:hypothetical protein